MKVHGVVGGIRGAGGARYMLGQPRAAYKVLDVEIEFVWGGTATFSFPADLLAGVTVGQPCEVDITFGEKS